MAQPLLFEPISLRDVTLKNRVVVAPMHQYSAIKGFATDWHLMNAGRYAAGGAGLVIMESTKVERRGCGTVGDLGIWDDAFVPGLKRCVDFIRLHNSVPGIQLGHSGRKARANRPFARAVGAVARGTRLGVEFLAALEQLFIHRRRWRNGGHGAGRRWWTGLEIAPRGREVRGDAFDLQLLYVRRIEDWTGIPFGRPAVA